jgi:hypothetical protein
MDSFHSFSFIHYIIFYAKSQGNTKKYIIILDKNISTRRNFYEKIYSNFVVWNYGFGLAGCVSEKTKENEIKDITTPTTTDIEIAEPETEIPEIEAPEVEIPEENNMKLKTKYYSIQLPEEWEETCMYEIQKNKYLHVYEIESNDICDGGWLFSLEVYGPEEDFTFLPSYELIAEFTDEDVKYSLVAIYPTDVQFSQETAEQYLEMSNQINNILETIELSDNVEIIETSQGNAAE